MLPAEVQSIIANIGSLADQLQQYERGEDATEPPEEGEDVGKAKVNKSVDKLLAMFADLEENEKVAALAALQALSTGGEPEPELPEGEVAMDVGKAEGATGEDDAEKRLTGDLPDGTQEALPEIEKAVDAAKSLVAAGVLKWSDKNEAAATKALAKATQTIAKAVSQHASVLKSLQEAVAAVEETIGDIFEGLGVAKEVTKSFEAVAAGNGRKPRALVNSDGDAVESTQETIRVLKDLINGRGRKDRDEEDELEEGTALMAGRRKEAVQKSLRGALKGGLFLGGRV